jgi:flagellar basal-body rod protein FlgB
MFIERLINGGAIPAAEQSVRFTAARHQLIAENIANISTDGYVTKDLNEAAFHNQLASKLASRSDGDVDLQMENPKGLMFHDGNNRSPEELMSNLSKNALEHNMYLEFLHQQFSSIEMALREKVS